jgi:hypothetical protein
LDSLSLRSLSSATRRRQPFFIARAAKQSREARAISRVLPPPLTLTMPLPPSPIFTPPVAVKAVVVPAIASVPVAPPKRPSTILADVALPEWTSAVAPPDNVNVPAPL